MLVVRYTQGSPECCVVLIRCLSSDHTSYHVRHARPLNPSWVATRFLTVRCADGNGETDVREACHGEDDNMGISQSARHRTTYDLPLPNGTLIVTR